MDSIDLLINFTGLIMLICALVTNPSKKSFINMSKRRVNDKILEENNGIITTLIKSAASNITLNWIDDCDLINYTNLLFFSYVTLGSSSKRGIFIGAFNKWFYYNGYIHLL